MQLYGSASAEPFLLLTFPENWGARLRISGGCPARGEPEALINLCSSIACRAAPCQRCSPVLQALIYLSIQLYGSASAEPFFVAHEKTFRLLPLVAATLPLLSLRDIFHRPGEVGPQGDGFSGNDKVSGTAQRRPLGGAVERSETEGISLTAPPKARCGYWASQPVSSGSHFKSSHAKGAAARLCGSPGGCFGIQALTRGLRSRCTDPRSSWRKRPS